MKNIGLLVAVELDAVTKKYKDKIIRDHVKGFDVYKVKTEDYNLYFVHTKEGEIRAAGGAQMLFDTYDIDLLINFGVVGGLREDLEVEDICFVDKVVHYDMDISAIDKIEKGRYAQYPDIYLRTNKAIMDKVKEMYEDIPVFTCASGDKFIDSREAKLSLAKEFGADICDMEAAAVVLISDLNQKPNLIIKIVSDSLTGGAGEYEEKSGKAADMCINIVEQILKEEII
ncbi:MAG: 5'-methylthioadenosine/S-adenosylhomocysteine nucleosidase [Anaerococcus sp.]|nr:5'-methylthioadenosine/S-adenosylhomocysteine nucleosidase [Anaerococcus sp.]